MDLKFVAGLPRRGDGLDLVVSGDTSSQDIPTREDVAEGLSNSGVSEQMDGHSLR